MSDIIKKTQELSDLVKKEPVIAEYLRLKEIFENNEELAYLRKEIALAKSEKRSDDYNKLKQMYDNHPLVKNYYQAREDAFALLDELHYIVQ